MKVIETHKIWASRIAKNLEVLGAADEKTAYKAILSAVKSDAEEELTAPYLRQIGTRIGRNAPDRERFDTALEVLKLIGLKAPKAFLKLEPFKSSNGVKPKAKPTTAAKAKLKARVKDIVEDAEDSQEELSPFAMDLRAAMELMSFMKQMQAASKKKKAK